MEISKALNNSKVFSFTVSIKLYIAYGGWTNPLSESSKEYLRTFKINHSDVHVLFQE